MSVGSDRRLTTQTRVTVAGVVAFLVAEAVEEE